MFLKKLKIELPYPAISCLGIYPEKTVLQQHTCTPVLTADWFTIAETWKQPKCPTTHDKEDVVYIYMYVYIYTYIYTHKGMLFSHKKEWDIAILSNMNGPRDCHTEWSKSDREKPISYDVTYMCNL